MIFNRLLAVSLILSLGVLAGCNSGDHPGDLGKLNQKLSKDGFRRLTGKEITKAFAGNTLKGISHEKKYVVYFYDVQKSVGVWGDNTDEGFWSIEGDDYCQRWKNWADGKTRAMQVAMKGDRIRFIRNNEVYRNCRLLKGNVDGF